MSIPENYDWRPLLRSSAATNYKRRDEYDHATPETRRARIIEAAKIAWMSRMYEALAEPEYDLFIRDDIDEFLTTLRNSGLGIDDAGRKDEFLRVVAEGLNG